MIGQINGIESLNKNFISVCHNPTTGKYDISYNSYIKSPFAKVYDIDSDYDFGSINPLDAAVDMYIKGQTIDSGVTQRN